MKIIQEEPAKLLWTFHLNVDAQLLDSLRQGMSNPAIQAGLIITRWTVIVADVVGESEEARVES